MQPDDESVPLPEPGSLGGRATLRSMINRSRKVFPRLTLRQIIQFPLEIGGVVGQYSIQGHGTWRRTDRTSWRPASCNRTRVGGTQSALRTPLKKEGLLTRDSRVKERKKYGQKGARKRFQYSKHKYRSHSLKKGRLQAFLFLCRWVHTG